MLLHPGVVMSEVKPQPEDQPLDKIKQVRFTEATLDEVNLAARRMGVSPSDFIRMAVLEKLERVRRASKAD